MGAGSSIESNKRSGHPVFYELIEEMGRIHSIKNQDYGDGNPLGNFMLAKSLGVDPFLGILIRLSDKWARICSLAKKTNNEGAVKDETIEDTLIDMANYSLLAIVIRRENEDRM